MSKKQIIVIPRGVARPNESLVVNIPRKCKGSSMIVATRRGNQIVGEALKDGQTATLLQNHQGMTPRAQPNYHQMNAINFQQYPSQVSTYPTPEFSVPQPCPSINYSTATNTNSSWPLNYVNEGLIVHQKVKRSVLPISFEDEEDEDKRLWVSAPSKMRNYTEPSRNLQGNSLRGMTEEEIAEQRILLSYFRDYQRARRNLLSRSPPYQKTNYSGRYLQDNHGIVMPPVYATELAANGSSGKDSANNARVVNSNENTERASVSNDSRGQTRFVSDENSSNQIRNDTSRRNGQDLQERNAETVVHDTNQNNTTEKSTVTSEPGRKLQYQSATNPNATN